MTSTDSSDYTKAIKAEAHRIAFDVEEYMVDQVEESVQRNATGNRDEVANDLLSAVREEVGND